jgi:CrcB protein
MSDILFVSIGAILGANIRFKIHHKLGNLNLDKGFLILVINTFASFGLGLFLSLVEQFRAFTYSYQLILFFSIGFFGSLSTFSSFVYDLFDLCFQLEFFRALKLFIFSISIGIIACAFGFFLGNQ